MHHADRAHGDTITNEVKVDLDVFGALMLDGVRGHVDGANIIAEHNRSRRRWSMKLMEELANPTSLGNGDFRHIKNFCVWSVTTLSLWPNSALVGYSQKKSQRRFDTIANYIIPSLLP
jgi:hypothetical protein